jgi:uncharacterized membrane protein YhhN
MHYSIGIGALFVAAMDWLAVGYNWRKVEVFLKPAVMVVLIIWLILMGGLTEWHLSLFLAGAFFSMIGDLFMLYDEKQKYFLLGLLSFLLAHLAYIFAIDDKMIVFTPELWILAAMVLVSLVFTGVKVLGGAAKLGWQKMSVPMAFYMLVIGTMLFSAVSRLFVSEWDFVPAVFLAVGAILFTLSDTCLSWNKFVAPIRYGRVKLMTSYHVGQIAIILGAILQFSDRL